MQRPDAQMVRAALKAKGQYAPSAKEVKASLAMPFLYFADKEHMEMPWLDEGIYTEEDWHSKIKIKPDEWMFDQMVYMFKSRGVLSRHTIVVAKSADFNKEDLENIKNAFKSNPILPDDYLVQVCTWDTSVNTNSNKTSEAVTWLPNKQLKKLQSPNLNTFLTSIFLVQNEKFIKPTWAALSQNKYPDIYKHPEKEKEVLDVYIDSVDMFLTTIQAMHDWLKHSDKHPVEVTPVKQPKLSSVNKDAPWRRATGPRILFLDRMPTTQTESTGTHASPKPHQRRGHWRELSHPRYRHHPQYKQKIWVKPSFIGPEQAVYEGNLYRLIKPLDEILAA